MNQSNANSTIAEIDMLQATAPVKILIVDDRDENLVSLESIIEGPGRSIFKADSGKAALALALEHEFAIALLDVQMPEMDGFELARYLKANDNTKDSAIIFVTALSKEEKYTLQGFQEGAVDYLHKPLNINIVKAKVSIFERLYLQRLAMKESATNLARINKQLDEFVYIVSHDLKAPLRGIASLSSFLEDELGTGINDESKELLGLIKSRTTRMQSLIDGILKYSRLSNSKADVEEVDVKELLHAIIDLIAPPDHFKFEIPDTLPILQTEKVKLHEVFQNLISNGIKYNNNEKGCIKIHYRNEDGTHHFGVEDNGVGIKPEHQDKIWGIFQTLQPKDKAESTGVGLTIVKKLVEQQGGEVTIQSTFGSGSTFWFVWGKSI